MKYYVGTNLKIDCKHITEKEDRKLFSECLTGLSFIGNKKEFKVSLILDETGRLYNLIKEWKKYGKPTDIDIDLSFSEKNNIEKYSAILYNYELNIDNRTKLNESELTLFFNIIGER